MSVLRQLASWMLPPRRTPQQTGIAKHELENMSNVVSGRRAVELKDLTRGSKAATFTSLYLGEATINVRQGE